MNKLKTVSFDNEISLDEIILKAQTLRMEAFRLPGRISRQLEAPIFVVGSPRSGTTVLGRCLGAHSQGVTAEESLVLLPLWRMYADLYAGDIPSGVAHLLEYISDSAFINALGDLADSVFFGLLTQSGAKVYIDHTPWYGTIAPFVKTLYPDARFVHIIRDGRQVTRSLQESYKRGYEWAGATIGTQSQVWSNVSIQTAEVLEKYTSDTVTVRYLDLITSPEVTLKRITNFLDLPYEESMLVPLQKPHATSHAGISFGLQALQERYTDDGWPVDWNEEDRSIFITFAGASMDMFFGNDWKNLPQ